MGKKRELPEERVIERIILERSQGGMNHIIPIGLSIAWRSLVTLERIGLVQEFVMPTCVVNCHLADALPTD